jgi:hypothetical protein
MTFTKSLLLLIFPLLALANANAQEFKQEFGFRSDNDSYLAQGSDRYYTNGLFINYRRAAPQQNLKEGMEKKIYELSIGQKIFNPQSGYAPDPAAHERPFAGYLYVGGAINWFRTDESALKAGVEIGTTGPNSLAEDGQRLLHNTVGFYTLAGWEYQIKNEMAATLAVQYIRLLHHPSNNVTDFTFEGYANAGNVFSGLGAGILFRAGRINQLFNSGYTNAVIGNNPKTKALVKSELFFYAKPQLNVVAYDATIQGSMFNNSSPVTFGAKPIVFAQQLGLNYSSQRFTFDFGMVFKTKEVKSPARAHQYGSISMYYRFN